MDDDDRDLLESFATHGDQAAFQTLVCRHLDAVHAVARRVTCNEELAKDVTQNTFIRLTRRASSITRQLSLSAWLHRTARSLAIDLVRAEERRRRLESKAQPPGAEREIAWEELAPFVDGLVEKLPAADREAVLLRYYRGRSHGEIGRRLGLSENAARQRVLRALERLRIMFVRRGIAVGPTGFATLLEANAATPVPSIFMGTIFGIGQSVSPATALWPSFLIGMTTFSKLVILACACFAAGAVAAAWDHQKPAADSVTASPRVAPAGHWRAADLRSAFVSAGRSSDRRGGTPLMLRDELSKWSDAELREALQESLRSPEQMLGGDAAMLTGQLTAELLRRDTPSFLSWSGQLKSPEEKRIVSRWITSCWPEGRAEEGFAWLLDNADFLAGAPSDLSWRIVREAADQRALRGPQEVEDLLMTLQGTDLNFSGKEITFPSGFNFSALVAQPGGMAWLKSYRAPELVRGWMEQNPKEAFPALLALGRPGDAEPLGYLIYSGVPGGRIASQISEMEDRGRRDLVSRALHAYNRSSLGLTAFRAGLTHAEDQMAADEWIARLKVNP